MAKAKLVAKREAYHAGGDKLAETHQPHVETAITQAANGYPSDLIAFIKCDEKGGYTQAKRALINYVKASTNLVWSDKDKTIEPPKDTEVLWKIDEWSELGCWWDRKYRAPDNTVTTVAFTDVVYAKSLKQSVMNLGKKAKACRSAKAKAMHREVLTALAAIIE